MASLVISEMVATTLSNRTTSMADDVSNSNWLWSQLREKGHFKTIDGGRDMAMPLAAIENASTVFFSGYETLSIVQQAQQITSAVYNWKQLASMVLISDLEALQNSAKWQALNLIESRSEVAIASMSNKAGTATYSNGSGTSGKEFGGLALLIADNPGAAGTVGGINQVTNLWWRNQTSQQIVVLTSANITGFMNAMWLATLRGADHPDIISADYVAFNAYETSLQNQQMFTHDGGSNAGKMAARGFESLKYKSAAVIADAQCPKGLGTGAGGGRMYFVNTDYLYFGVGKGHDFTVGKSQKVTNAQYSVTPVTLYGNFLCSNRARQGVLCGTAP